VPIRTTIRKALSFSRHRCRAAQWVAPLAAAFLLGGCVYRLDIQQGNLVDEKDLAQVDVGMTRSQVQFLLGTPMVADSFHEDRWDYPYYLQKGHERDAERRWFVVYFQNDRVVRVDRNLEAPTATDDESGRRAKRSKASS
jgi:outer membrane protein assembly factor BamE